MRDERGYTLIELSVVLGIVAVLIAVATPLLLGARDRAHDTETKAALRDGLVAGHVYQVGTDSYADFDAAAAETVEPSLTWADEEAGFDAVVIVVATDDVLHLVGSSRSGRYFCLRDTSAAVAVTSVTYGSGSSFSAVDETSECDDLSW